MVSEEDDPIKALCRTLEWNHPLRHQAMSLLADPQTPILDIKPALSALIYPSLFRRNERAVASWLIARAEWSDSQQEKLSEAMSKAIERAMKARKPGRTILRWFGGSMFVSHLLLLACVFLFHMDMFDDVLDYCVAMLTLSTILTVLGAALSLPFSVWMRARKLRGLSPVIEALAQVGRPDSMAALALALDDATVRDAAASSLARITARLQPDDYGTLSSQTVPALCSALTTESPQNVRVILQALTVIGDGRAISYVDSLAREAIHPDIVKTASHLLPILCQRARDSQASALLLRASDAPPESGQTLLRAAREQSVTDSSHLLRMAAPQGTEEQIQDRR